MKKLLLIILLLVLAVIIGSFFAFSLPTQQIFAASLFAKITRAPEPSLALKLDKKFNGVIYYVSDRKQFLHANGDVSYLSESDSSKVSYGSIRIKVPDAHSIGEKLSISAIQKITPLPIDDFVSQLKHHAEKPLIIWVHGHKNSFEGSTVHYAQIATDLNIDANFLTYDWASNDSLFGYADSVKRVGQSSAKLADLLELIVSTVKPQKIIIIAHSLGCRVVCEAFDNLYEKPRWSDQDLELDQVVFLAPNVDKDDFDKKFRYQLASMVNKLTVYVASDDNALLISKLIYNINSVGLPTGFSEQSNADEIQALLYYQKLLPNKVDIIDVSYFQKKGFVGHFYFRERPVLEDLYKLIGSNYPVSKRYLLKYRVNEKSPIDYWVIPP